MNDEQLLALGRAVYAFQTVEWLTIWVLCFLLEAYPPDFDPLTCGQLIERLREEIKTATHLSDGERQALRSWASSLGEINQIRQDVFHSHPQAKDQLVRRRPKTNEYVTIDVARLDAATKRFISATEAGTTAWYGIWSHLIDQMLDD